MTATEWLVIGGGLAVIVWLNWYFLFADRTKNSKHSNSVVTPKDADASGPPGNH